MPPSMTTTREMLLTDPDQAADFVKATQLDALAIAIGTSHGAYKFTRQPTGDIPAIDRVNLSVEVVRPKSTLRRRVARA